MIKVNNQKVIRKLSVRNMKGSRGRNWIAVLAIALTALLFTSVLEMGYGAVASMQRTMMVAVGGDAHASVKYVTDEEYERISRHPLIREMAYCMPLCDSVDNEGLLKRRAELWYYDKNGLEFGFISPTGGHLPQKEDEVIADTKTLELLGVPLEEGSSISLDITVHGTPVRRDFKLAGWWESDPAFNVGQIFTSRTYVDAHREELYYSYKSDYSMTGASTGYIKFADSIGIEEKLGRVITESGYSMDEEADHYIRTGVNWSYLTTGVGLDFTMTVALLGVLALFVLTGYLIIYNIFQISVLRDIRFYGLLKTIGTTGKQIRSIIRQQGLWLSAAGIPLGLVGGFLAGRQLLPLVMEQTSFAGSAVVISLHPMVFIGAVLFSLLTVSISTGKPGKMAARVSPVEAVKYSDAAAAAGSRARKKKGGVSLWRMASANLKRSTKRTVLVVAGLSLTLVLTDIIFTFAKSVNEEKALERFCDSDFRIGHADLFNLSSDSDFAQEESALSESFIQAVENQEGFEIGGRLYSTPAVYKSGSSRQTKNHYEDGSYSTTLYGVEDFPYSRFVLADGELNQEKLLSGKYILEGVTTDDHGVPEPESFNHEIGESVTIQAGGREYTMTVLGHVVANMNTNTTGRWYFSAFYLPSRVYQEITGNHLPMSYAFNVAKKQERAVEGFLKEYTSMTEPDMNYDSKFTAMASITSLKRSAVMIGGTLAMIIGIIGILNYINAVMTSILTRRREFAMLQSVGMTRRQLTCMLSMEGTYYVIFTAGCSLVLSLVFSLFAVRPFCQSVWFTDYHFVILPLAVMIPCLFVLGIFIPILLYKLTVRKSIVERLREAE